MHTSSQRPLLDIENLYAYNTIRCNLAYFNEICSNMIRYDKIQYDKIWYNMMPCSTPSALELDGENRVISFDIYNFLSSRSFSIHSTPDLVS